MVMVLGFVIHVIRIGVGRMVECDDHVGSGNVESCWE